MGPSFSWAELIRPFNSDKNPTRLRLGSASRPFAAGAPARFELRMGPTAAEVATFTSGENAPGGPIAVLSRFKGLTSCSPIQNWHRSQFGTFLPRDICPTTGLSTRISRF
jgi:hypothetical protein